MNVVKCKSGHFFDGDKYARCPHCGEEVAGVSVPKVEKKGLFGLGKKDVSQVPSGGHYTPTPVYDYDEPTSAMSNPVSVQPQKYNPANESHTLDFWQTSAHGGETGGKQEEVSEPVAEVKNDGMRYPDELPTPAPAPTSAPVETPSSEPASLKEAIQKASANSEGKTMSYFSVVNNASATTNTSQDTPKQPAFSEPVTGWLVCVSGAHFGQTFSIFAGKNSIGRGEDNKVVLPSDNSISRSKHAFIVYEPKKRGFYLQPGDSSGLTYLNEEYITESKKLAAKDVIELGDSKFIFVPLCGEDFSWEDYMNK